MLLSFGARNVFSFKEGFEVNLSLDGNCPNDISHGKSFANIMAIKGANASGKTNVLKVLNFLFDFGENSFNYENDKQIRFFSYFSSDEPSSMYIKFSINDDVYIYELELTEHKVISENLYKNGEIIIERIENELKYFDDEYKELEVIKLKNTASLISTANQYDMDSIAIIYSFFIRKMSNVGVLGLRDNFIDYKNVSAKYSKDTEAFQFAKHIITNSDTGIYDILIREYDKTDSEEKEYQPAFIYKIGNEKKVLTYQEQSSGVKSLYRQLAAYEIVISTGGVLILDEFDINLHPDLLPLLLDFFDNPEKNEHDAQLIFTTHNTEIMERLKKYRTILVNKEDNESFLYRLDELNGEVIRNDRPLTPLYNSGRIGGKPKPTL